MLKNRHTVHHNNICQCLKRRSSINPRSFEFLAKCRNYSFLILSTERDGWPCCKIILYTGDPIPFTSMESMNLNRCWFNPFSSNPYSFNHSIPCFEAQRPKLSLVHVLIKTLQGPSHPMTLTWRGDGCGLLQKKGQPNIFQSCTAFILEQIKSIW